MFLIQSEKDLAECFRPIDRKQQIELPKGIKFPLFVRDYLAWPEPSGARVYLVFATPGTHKPLGIAFRRDQSTTKGSHSRMCDWCHATGASDEIGLLTATASASKRVGVNLCLNLNCAEKLETSAHLSGQIPRELSQKLLDRMSRFARQVLF